jgi:putative membrane protein
MLDQAIAAYLHFLSIFATLACLVAEAALYRPRMSRATVTLLRRLDLAYLAGAVAIIATGLSRVFFYAKGPAFYAGNPVFWIKMALFLAVAPLSLPPTIHYIVSAKAAAGDDIVVAPGLYRRMRGCIALELAIFALIPLAAALMARGIGM